jgi:hypothetical protein
VSYLGFARIPLPPTTLVTEILLEPKFVIDSTAANMIIYTQYLWIFSTSAEYLSALSNFTYTLLSGG